MGRYLESIRDTCYAKDASKERVAAAKEMINDCTIRTSDEVSDCVRAMHNIQFSKRKKLDKKRKNELVAAVNHRLIDCKAEMQLCTPPAGMSARRLQDYSSMARYIPKVFWEMENFESKLLVFTRALGMKNGNEETMGVLAFLIWIKELGYEEAKKWSHGRYTIACRA